MLRRRKESDLFCPNVGRISFCVHFATCYDGDFDEFDVTINIKKSTPCSYPISGASNVFKSAFDQSARTPISGILRLANVHMAFTCPVTPSWHSHVQLAFKCPVGIQMSSGITWRQSRPVATSGAWWQCDRISVCA